MVRFTLEDLLLKACVPVNHYTTKARLQRNRTRLEQNIYCSSSILNHYKKKKLYLSPYNYTVTLETLPLQILKVWKITEKEKKSKVHSKFWVVLWPYLWFISQVSLNINSMLLWKSVTELEHKYCVTHDLRHTRISVMYSY